MAIQITITADNLPALCSAIESLQERIDDNSEELNTLFEAGIEFGLFSPFTIQTKYVNQ